MSGTRSSPCYHRLFWLGLDRSSAALPGIGVEVQPVAPVPPARQFPRGKPAFAEQRGDARVFAARVARAGHFDPDAAHGGKRGTQAREHAMLVAVDVDLDVVGRGGTAARDQV